VIEIVEPGPLTTVQDGGRPGYAHLGVPRSGAFDRQAMALANSLAGNDPETPLLEVTFGGLEFRVVEAITLAAAGAACPGLDHHATLSLKAGATVRLGRPAAGLRTYLAFHGGLAVAAVAVLGSASTDTLSGTGPAPLRAGERIAVRRDTGDVVGGHAAAARLDIDTPFAVTLGPRDDWFAAPQALFETTWTVRPDSNRVGIRLDGSPLVRATAGELPSEGLLPGAIQVPPDGRPILLGPDAPVTGGYPVVGVVSRTDLDRAAQLRPGDPVRFSARTGG
jgi:biotin-dependent carboxylase-like uncharacterized protein